MSSFKIVADHYQLFSDFLNTLNNEMLFIDRIELSEENKRRTNLFMQIMGQYQMGNFNYMNAKDRERFARIKNIKNEIIFILDNHNMNKLNNDIIFLIVKKIFSSVINEWLESL